MTVRQGWIHACLIIYELQVHFYRSMSHAECQQIIHLLFEDPKNVNFSLDGVKPELCFVSYGHIAPKRNRFLERRSQEIVFQLTNPKIAEAFGLMQEILFEQISKNSSKVKQLKQAD